MNKTLLFIVLIFFSCLIKVSAQLKVSSSGKVGIGITGTPVSQLSIGGSGSIYAKTYIKSDGYALQINSMGKSSIMPNNNNFYGAGIKISGIPTSTYGHIGIHSSIEGVYNSSNGYAVGVLGIAGGGKNGYNYGVSGVLSQNKNGAGIYGSSKGNSWSQPVLGRYAGYFDGDVQIDGDLSMWTGRVRYIGDNYFITNPQPLNNVLARVMSIEPISYKLLSDTLYAFLADNMSDAFPSLVDANYCIDYASMVPILVKAVKEMQQEIESLQMVITQANLVRTTEGLPETTIRQSERVQGAVLYQNTPNPFNEHSIIHFYLPNNAPGSYICIFDMTGKLQKQIPITPSMQSIDIEGGSFQPGMYIYSLIIGGSEIDTKRMIITN